jgi:outer membrane lipoprotein-sorting protein
METEHQVTDALDDVGGALRRQPSVRNEVIRRVTQHVATNGNVTTSPARWGGRRLLGKLAAVAACAVLALLLWNPWGRGIGAGEAFAAAIANVERSHTFACRQIVTQVDENGEKSVREMTFMFKEPNLERLEYGEGMGAPEVMVTDYAKKVRLVILPQDKTAELQDLSTMYATDDKTGELKPVELGTHARDDVLRISAQAVKDLGKTKLNGREVWALQSNDGAQPVKTVFVNPADGKPVQVEILWPTTGASFVYTDIQIDAELDDALFSVEAPAGYATEALKKPVDEMNGKMLVKIRDLGMECAMYANSHDGKWPTTLDDLRATGTDAKKLQTLLAAPDSKDNKPVILYRQPKAGQTEAIVLYEAPEFRRGGKVIAGFMDGHAQMMSKKEFDDAMK